VAVVAQLWLVRGREAAEVRGEGCGEGAAFRCRQRNRDRLAERGRRAALVDDLLRARDDLQGAGLALVARAAPGGDAVAAEDHADRLRVRLIDGGDVEAELEAGAAPRDPGHAVAEAL